MQAIYEGVHLVDAEKKPWDGYSEGCKGCYGVEKFIRECRVFGMNSDEIMITRARELFPEHVEEHFFTNREAQEKLPHDLKTIFWNVGDNYDSSSRKNRKFLFRLKELIKGGRIILGFYHEDPSENDRRLEQVQKMGNPPAEVRRSENGHIFAACDIAA